MKSTLKKLLLLSSVFAAAQQSLIAQTINASTFSASEARALGPGTMSGRITAIEGVNATPHIIYVGTAGGGVWKTTNAGMSFKSIFDKYTQSIGAVAVDQKNPKVVYVGTGESNMRNSVSIGTGLYKTTDAGDNWVKIGGLDSTEHIARIAIDPSNSNTLYVAAPGALWSNSPHRGLYKSTNGGKTFEKILFVNDSTGCAEVAIDPNNANTIYASTWQFRRQAFSFNSGGQGSSFYRSIDGGKNWTEITKGLPAKPLGRIAFTISPSSPQNLIAIVESKDATGLYITADGGNNWKSQSAIQNVIARPFYFSTLAFDPKDAKRVYRPAYSFSYSDDGGYSFSEAGVEGDYPHADMHAIWINPNNPNIIYVGTDGGVYFSINKGVNWKFVDALPVGQFYHVAVDNAKPAYKVYGGLQDNNSWVAPSSYAGGVANSEWKALMGGDGFWTVPDPTDENFAYAEAQGGTMFRINMLTNKMYSIQPKQGKTEEKLRWNWNTPIVTGVAANSKNLYTGAQYLYKSTNNGKDWERISPDLTTNNKAKQQQENSGGLSADNTSAENHCTIFTIAESKFDENTIWVGTDDGNLQYTTNAGKNWTNVSGQIAACGVPANTWVSSIELSLFDKQTIFATFDNHTYGDHKTYAAYSTNMGNTWTMLKSPEFTGFAHKIKQDIVNKNLLFLGTEMGLFTSIDFGKNWFRMKNGMPWYNLVRDMQIHPKTNDLIIGTHGRGIYILQDITPFRVITPEFAKKEAYLFETPELEITKGKLGYYAAAKIGYNGGNSSSLKSINYYLKDRLNNGDVKIEITDKDNKLVRTMLSLGKRKGINQATWDLRGMGPKTIALGMAKRDYSSFICPFVLPGTYNIKLTIADKEFNSKVSVVNDKENKALTYQVRQDIYNNCQQLINLLEKNAEINNQVFNTKASIDSALSKIKNKKNIQTLKDLSKRLDDLRSNLVGTKQASIFADEVKQREQIRDLYEEFCDLENKPSKLSLESVVMLTEKVKESEAAANKLITEAKNKLTPILLKENLDIQIKK